VSCPKCGATGVVPGRLDVGGERTSVSFLPMDLRWFAWRRSCAPVATFRACSNCGHLWNRVSASNLRDLVDASASAELIEKLRRRAVAATSARCPECADPVFVEGHFAWAATPNFEPDYLRKAPLFKSPLLLHDIVRACTSCGHAWSLIDPAELRRLL